MAADVELLPSSVAAFTEALHGDRGSLDAWLEVHDEREVRAHVEAYARANIGVATAAKDAEIEALREAYRGQVIERANEIKLRAKADAEIEALRAEVAKRDGIDPWAVLLRAQEAEARAERLAEALREARDCIEDWAGYASDYFREKHDLAGDLAKIDALLRDQGEG